MSPGRALVKASSERLSYVEVGASAGALPPGYRHLRRTQELGTGSAAFEAAAELQMSWEMHRRAGLQIDATAPLAQEGVVVVLGLGVGRLRLHAPCRVVLVRDEPGRRGFAYGTLHGHPETGEELFEVTIDPAGRVHVDITAFSRPASWWSRMGGPVSRRVQDMITDRYLTALVQPT